MVKLSSKNPVTNADCLFTVTGVPGAWETFSGLRETISRAQYSDGQSNRKRFTASGSSSLEEVTITRTITPEDAEDIAAYDWAQRMKAGDEFQCEVRFVKRTNDVEFRGNRVLYLYGCRISEIAIMQGMDTGAGDTASRLEVKFSLDDYKWQ
jgi:hypothetical protein